jgi:hypothetical protein
MKTLQKNPESMTVIINIQMMNEKINPKYNRIRDFKRLNNLSVLDLYEEQDKTIIEYNKTFKAK